MVESKYEQKLTTKKYFEEEAVTDDEIVAKKFMKAAKALERMINQNIYDQVIQGNPTKC